jgi:cobalt-zinc-cadmium efflux system protein
VAEPDVVEVHDLHVWTVTSGFPALSAHVLVAADADCHAARRRLERRLAESFGLTHTTLQVEHAEPASATVELGKAEARRTPLRH